MESDGLATARGVDPKERFPVSIRFERAVILHLRRIAREESVRRDYDVTMADLVREAVETAYPLREISAPALLPKGSGSAD
jgi:hypothetical protein